MAGLNLSGVDFAYLMVLVAGFIVGKKRGMSAELIDVFQWLVIITVAGMAHRSIANSITSLAQLSKVFANILAYGSLALGIKVFFIVIKDRMGEKLVGSDIFGSFEYYLGMAAGTLRFACMIVVFISILGARQYTDVEIQRSLAQQEKDLGTTFFPTFGGFQRQAIQRSIVGRFVTKYLADYIITPSLPGPGTLERKLGKKREKALEEVLGK